MLTATVSRELLLLLVATIVVAIVGRHSVSLGEVALGIALVSAPIISVGWMRLQQLRNRLTGIVTRLGGAA